MNTLTNLTNNNTTTMTSRDIALVTGKEHRNIIADIEKLNKTYEEMTLLKVQQGFYTHERTGNQQHKQFILNKEQTLDLITGYTPELRIKINRRWAELEQQLANPVAAFNIPTTLSGALRLAAELQEAVEHQTEQVMLLQNKVEEDREKVMFFEAVGNTKKLYSIATAASNHGISSQALNKILEKGVYDSRSSSRVFKADFIAKGYGEMKLRDKGYTQPMLTEKGLKWVSKSLYTSQLAYEELEKHYHGANKIPKMYKDNLEAFKNPVEINVARLQHTQDTIQTINNLLH